MSTRRTANDDDSHGGDDDGDNSDILMISDDYKAQSSVQNAMCILDISNVVQGLMSACSIVLCH